MELSGEGQWNSGNIWTIVIFALLLVLAVMITYANFQNGRRFRIESSTSLTPIQALDALQVQFARDGWNLGFRDDTTLVMKIDRRANLGSTVAIGCLSMWLALIYLVMPRTPVVVDIQASEVSGGSRLITNGSKSGVALDYVALRLRELPKS